MRLSAVFAILLWTATACASPSVSSAKVYFLRGDYVQAARASEQLLVESGGNSGRGMDEVHYLAGLSYLKEGRYAQAREHFESVLKNFSSSAFEEAANIGIADVRCLEGDFKGAGALYESMARKAAYRDFKPALYGRLRLVGLKTGNTEQAGKYAEKLRKQYPSSPEGKDIGGLAMSERITRSTPGVEQVAVRASAQGEVYFVQVGAFGSRPNAERLKSKLVAQGYTVHIAESASGEKKSYKVRVGSENTHVRAQALKTELSSQGYPTTICQ
jgi:tetratricopeptide (TPR) repeat protein